MPLPETLASFDRRTVMKTLGVTAAGLLGTAGTATAQNDEQTAEPTLIAEFDPPQLPENISVAEDGTHYLSMAPTHEIWQLTPGTNEVAPEPIASLPRGEGGQSLLGSTTTADGSALLACNNTRNEETHGVWRVPRDDGSPEVLATIDPKESTLNGITGHPAKENSYLVTDHAQGVIWRVSEKNCAEKWIQSPLLEPNPYAALPVGVDGISIGPDGDVWVDNLSFGAILRIPVQSDGSADSPQVFLKDDGLFGSDGLTVDSSGNIYVAVNVQNKVVRVTSGGEIQTIVSGAPLDFPADVYFCQSGESALYIANFALLSAQSEDEQANPSYVRVRLDQ